MDPRIIDTDTYFNSPRDFLGYRNTGQLDRIRDYLQDAINTLRHPGLTGQTAESAGHLQWTASKTALVELIYALQSGGVYNNGQMEIKEIAETFQHVFKVDLGNYYHVFNEIRLRKKNRTSLLDPASRKSAAENGFT